jgi:hypothetical protein
MTHFFSMSQFTLAYPLSKMVQINKEHLLKAGCFEGIYGNFALYKLEPV